MQPSKKKGTEAQVPQEGLIKPPSLVLLDKACHGTSMVVQGCRLHAPTEEVWSLVEVLHAARCG